MYLASLCLILEYGSTLFIGAKPTHLEELDRVQATMERISGFNAQSLAGRRETALIALSFQQMDGAGECREGLRGYAPLLHTVKLTDGKLNSRHSVLLRPDYSEKNQSRQTSGESGSSAEVKVDATAVS